jgi:glycosyltransferase involved in cell wall biosynthesis
VNPRYGWVDQEFAKTLLRAHRHQLPDVAAVAVNSTLLQGDHASWVGMDPAAITVCANGIDIAPLDAEAAGAARTRIRAERGIPEDAVVIINVGRFSAEKGQRTLIEANRLLLARGTPRPVIWLLCGDGITLPDVQQLAAQYGMTNVHFAGRTSQVRDMLSAADIFVMPSDFEGMPNAMMEAMAAGLPCISTRVSGARDVAREDVEALYYDARDYVQLARHLARLIEDPGEARRLGDAAAVRIQQFSVRRFVGCFESMFDRIRGES